MNAQISLHLLSLITLLLAIKKEGKLNLQAKFPTITPGICSWTGWFEPYLVAWPCDKTHMYTTGKAKLNWKTFQNIRQAFWKSQYSFLKKKNMYLYSFIN